MAKEEEAMSGKSFLQFIGGDGDDADDDGDVRKTPYHRCMTYV